MKRKKLKNPATLALLCLFCMASQAQDARQPTDTLTKSIQKIQSELEGLKKIKLSGYLQAQFQAIDSPGAASYAGGNFVANVDKRFIVRRGRLKAAYSGNMTQYVLQIDVTEKGVGLKDAYAKITEPWLKAISLTIGAFNRPFGYEIEYSSSSRETPERGRMSQIIFANERDLGAMLTIQAPKTSSLHFLKADFAMVNGTSISGSDFDFQKDFIGRVRADRTTNNKKIQYGLGVSYYDGGWRQGTSRVYAMSTDSLGLSAYKATSDTANNGAISERQYTGGDFQLAIDWAGGKTTFRAEYIWGQQPATASASKSPDAQPASDTYIRNFNGAYFYFVQNILKTKNQLVVKYDWYDPNIKVAGNDIGKSVAGSGFGKTNATDIKYTTLGIGWAYNWDSNVKITACYDIVTNETSDNLAGYSKDLKDNVFTLRVQYKF